VAGLRLRAVAREREGGQQLAARVRVWGEEGCALAPPYIRGWPASLAPPPTLGRRLWVGRVGASFPPSFFEDSLRVSPWAWPAGP
jgi:hypothetical protein